MKFNLLNITLYKLLVNLFLIVFIILFFYKIHLENFIPITGDELNSILVYSSNLKTLLLKNFPGNVPFFNFIGYLNSKLSDFSIISFRFVSFIFFILHFWIIKKLKVNNVITFIFFLFSVNSYAAIYIGLYNSYIFSSFIFVFIFYLQLKNINEKYNKIILILLFIQIYDHLVNLYLVLPIITSLFIFSEKKKFIKEFFLFFLLPVMAFYLISILLTGVALLKINQINLDFVINLLFENFQGIFLNGFNRIFFYEAYVDASEFSFRGLIISLYLFDKLFLIFFIIAIIISILNIKLKKINIIFSYIIIFHIITIILINKDPAPRIFFGFFGFYFLFIFYFLDRFIKFKKLFTSSSFNFIILFILFLKLSNFNYLKKIKSSEYFNDYNFTENRTSLNYLKKECKLFNNNFSEMQKKNYYFNYIYLCNKKFNLSEFLNYYRS